MKIFNILWLSLNYRLFLIMLPSIPFFFWNGTSLHFLFSILPSLFSWHKQLLILKHCLVQIGRVWITLWFGVGGVGRGRRSAQKTPDSLEGAIWSEPLSPEGYGFQIFQGGSLLLWGSSAPAPEHILNTHPASRRYPVLWEELLLIALTFN